jgi:hypothetical protein
MRLGTCSDDNIDMMFFNDYFLSEGQITESTTITAGQNVIERHAFLLLTGEPDRLFPNSISFRHSWYT